MAAYISFQPSDYHNTTLYTGNNTDPHTITGVGFSADFTWIKDRSAVQDNYLFDTLRGATKQLISNNNQSEGAEAQSLKSWNSDGFVVGTKGEVNDDANTFVAWSWKMGTTSGIDTTGSTITPDSYSFNATAGFSLVKCTGNLTSGAKIPHGLGVAPTVVIVKRTGGGAGQWYSIWNISGLSDTQHLQFTTAAPATGTWAFNDTFPDAVNFTVGDNSETNDSGGMIAYCFAQKRGFTRIGSYVGNGNADGPFLYCGFRPGWILLKRFYDGTYDWYLWDNKRLGYNPDNDAQNPNADYADDTGNKIDILSNGFKVRATDAYVNQNGTKMAYMAFAEFPFVSSNSKAGTAR